MILLLEITKKGKPQELRETRDKYKESDRQVRQENPPRDTDENVV